MPLPHIHINSSYYSSKKKIVKKVKEKVPTVKIYTTTRLKRILRRIEGESWIAQSLLNGRINKDLLVKDPVNFIDISHSDPTKISYIPSKKMKQVAKKFSYENGYNSTLSLRDVPHSQFFKGKGRVKIKFGSFVNKLFKEADPKEIEKFSSLMKAIMMEPDFTMKVVQGEDIRKYYHYSYHASNKGSLGISCMRHDGCVDYFDMYVNNPQIKMLIMFDREKMVKARALLWTLGKENGLDDEFKFMDRVYTTNDDQVHHFIQWAKENGYNYKEKQSWNTPYRFKFKDDKFEKKMKIHLPDNPSKYAKSNGGHGLPYLDTFKWMNIRTGTLYNYKPNDDPEKRSIYTIVTTNGDVYGFNYIKEDTYHKEYWYEGEVRWIEYLKEEVSDRYCFWSGVNDTYLLKNHAIIENHLGDYIFNEEYEKFNNREAINKVIEAKKEQERIRQEKIRQTVKSTLPTFKVYLEAANAYLDGDANDITPEYEQDNNQGRDRGGDRGMWGIDSLNAGTIRQRGYERYDGNEDRVDRSEFTDDQLQELERQINELGDVDRNAINRFTEAFRVRMRRAGGGDDVEVDDDTDDNGFDFEI